MQLFEMRYTNKFLKHLYIKYCNMQVSFPIINWLSHLLQMLTIIYYFI